MGFHEAGALSTAPAATADTAYFGIWNGSGGAIRVREIGVYNTAATAGKLAIKRITARGTQTGTIAFEKLDAGDVAVTVNLDFTYSAQPTVSGGYIRRSHIAAAVGAGFVWTWWAGMGLRVENGAGIAIVVPTAVAGPACEVYAVIGE